MSYSQLGQVQNARNALAVSRNLVDSNSGQGYWFDWRLDQILMDEAATLIEQPRSNPTLGDIPSPK